MGQERVGRCSCRVRGGGPGSPPGILAAWLARGAVVQVRHAAPKASAMGRPGSSAAESNCRRRRHHPAVVFGRLPGLRLTETPASRWPAGHGGWGTRLRRVLLRWQVPQPCSRIGRRRYPAQLQGGDPTSSPRQPLRHSLRVGGSYPWLRWPSASVLVIPLRGVSQGRAFCG